MAPVESGLRPFRYDDRACGWALHGEDHAAPHESVALTGTIEHVFAHRFTLTADGQTHLADLTPKGLEVFPISEG